MISPSAEARRVTLTLFGFIVVAGVFAAPAASAQSDNSSGSQGSGTNDQEVYVSGEDGGSRGSGRSCSDGSNVTVVTDEGTSHPSGGGACRNEPSPTPVQTAAANRLSSSAAAQAPSPTPETATASPVVAASPLIYLNVETPRVVSDTTGGIGTPMVVGLLIAFAAAVYLAVRAVPRIMQRDVTHMIRQPEIPLLENPPSLPLPRTIADIYVRPDQPPPTEEIVLDGQLAEIHTEAP